MLLKLMASKSSLQRSRAQVSAEIGGVCLRSNLSNYIASTEPRSSERGNLFAFAGLAAIIVASTEPRSKDAEITGRATVWTGSVFASTEPRSSERGFGRGEHGPAVKESASTEPRSSERGNAVLRCFVPMDNSTLQRSRAQVSAEMPVVAGKVFAMS